MSLMLTLIFILLNIISLANCSLLNEYDIISHAACFNAFQVNQSTIFNAPQNGILEGIILTADAYVLPCPQDALNIEWGCMNLQDPTRPTFYTIFSKLIHASNYTTIPYYPTLHTQNIDTMYSKAKHHSSCGASCLVGYYTLLNTSRFETISELTFIGPSYNVTTSDTFILQYLSACCKDLLPFDTKHSKYICVDVDFLYTKDPSDALKPSAAPSDIEDTTAAPSVHHSTADDDITSFNWLVLVHITYDFSDDGTSCNISCATNIAKISTDYLLALARNATSSSSLVSYDDKITNMTDLSFDYIFELTVINAEIATELVHMYNIDGDAGDDEIPKHLMPKINEQTRLFVHLDDIILHHDKMVIAYYTTDSSAISMTSATARLVIDTNGNKDEWSLSAILAVNIAGCIAILILCVIFYRKNKRIRDTVDLYKTQNKELQDQLLDAMNNVDNDNTVTVPGQLEERLPREMPELPPEVSEIDNIDNEDSDTSEEMYVEMGTTNRGSTRKLRGVEGRVSLYRVNSDSVSTAHATANPYSYTHDGDPTGGMHMDIALDGDDVCDTPGVGEQQVALGTLQKTNSDSHQAFIVQSDFKNEL